MGTFIKFGLLTAILIGVAASRHAAGSTTYGSRVVDPLYKVVPDDDLSSYPAGYAPEVARGEYATWLVLIRKQSALTGISFEAEQPTMDGKLLPKLRIRYVGMIDVSQFEKKPGKDALRPESGKFPDPLFTDPPPSAAAGDLLELWVDVKIPADADPGAYRGNLIAHLNAGGKSGTEAIPLNLKVYSATVGRPDFLLSQTFYPGIGLTAGPTSPPAQADAYFGRLKAYAEDLASHGERVLRVSPFSFTAVKPDGSYDFSMFDRFVQVFRDSGSADMIQGGALGARSGGWVSDYDANVSTAQTGPLVTHKMPADSEEAKTFFASFLPALINHLKEKGWLQYYIQDIGDEPIPENVASWNRLKAYADQYEPGVPTFVTEPDRMVVDLATVNCPVLNSLDKDSGEWAPILHQHGRTFWFYVANGTQGEYANRFIDQPLMKVRVIPWIGFSCGAKGFLHWGYNSWYTTKGDPLTTPNVDPSVPPGDPWIVYRGAAGPIDSIRWEQTRDGMDDYVLLSIAATKDAAESRDLCKEVVRSFSDYDTSVEDFRGVRHKLLEFDSRS